MFTSEIINTLIRMQSGKPPVLPEEDSVNTSVSSKKKQSEIITIPFTVSQFLRYRVFHYKRIPHFLKSYSYDKGLETVREEDNVFVYDQPEYAKGEPVFYFFKFDASVFEKIGYALDQSERYWKFIKKKVDKNGNTVIYAVNESGMEEKFSSTGMNYGCCAHDDSDIISLQMIPAITISEDMEKYIFWNISNGNPVFSDKENEGMKLFKEKIKNNVSIEHLGLGILTLKEGVLCSTEELEKTAEYYSLAKGKNRNTGHINTIIFLNYKGDFIMTVDLNV